MSAPERDDEDARPTAEEMLARVRADTRPSRGRLRVYLGMAPGVGKTYTMLEEGHRRVERGTDLVVGFVETHGRSRTEALLEGLAIIPRLRVEYRGVVVEEMDTDGLITRHPEVALIDELAHTNVPGSPREKRWQDVELVRDAGIDVVSTCNVQHLESVADAVETITGAPVNERLPDSVLASADEVELVDMSPRALRQRMRHGNVYPPDRAQVALDRFFTEANLTALRELSLRFVTGRVDEQLASLAAGAGLDHLRLVGDRVLVMVDERRASRHALRRGATLAALHRAPLLAVSVETPAAAHLTFDAARDLRENLDFGADLGAEILGVTAADIAAGLIDVIRGRRVTQLVIANRASSAIDRFRRRPLIDQLLDHFPDLEVHVLGNDRAPGGQE